MKDKKAQSLILVLWVLVMLSLLALSLAHHVSLALKLTKYQRDRLKAYCLAQAGLNSKIAQLDNDKLEDDKEESLLISLKDEGAKININTTSQELLSTLFEYFKIPAARQKAENLAIWRGDIPDQYRIYENSGYPAKAKTFNSIEELLLVKEITREDYAQLKDFITVYNNGLININTASPEVLEILLNYTAKKLSLSDTFARAVLSELIKFRDKNGPVGEKSDINIPLTGSEEINILDNLLAGIATRSDNFLIEVDAGIGKIKSKIAAVYNRGNKKILYWHES